jgi:hypothetical protein
VGAFYRRQVDLDHIFGHVSVGLIMDAHRRGYVRGIDQAKAGVACFVEPVRKKADAVMVLRLKIFPMRIGDVG